DLDDADADEQERPPAPDPVGAEDPRAAEGEDDADRDQDEAEGRAVAHGGGGAQVAHDALPAGPEPPSSETSGRRCVWSRITTPTTIRPPDEICPKPQST